MHSAQFFKAPRPLDVTAPHYAHEPDPREPAALLTCPNRRCPVDQVAVRLLHLFKPESLLGYHCPACGRPLNFRAWLAPVRVATAEGS